MTGLLTKVFVTPGKKDPNKTWVMGTVLNLRDGSTSEFIVDKASLDPDFDPVAKALSAEDLADLGEKYETVEVDFDNKGKLTHMA